MAGAEHNDSGSYDGAVADHHTTSSTTETDNEKHHELDHDDPDREKKIEAALAEGHDADTPSNIGYLLDERGELKRQRSIAEQANLALAKSRSHASHHTGTGDLEKGVTPDSEGKDAHAVVEGESDPNIVWWDGPDDPENPMNWPSWRKVLTCCIISFLTFVTPLASSIFAPGVPDLMADFRSDSNLLASFVVSVYVLGFAFGPLVMGSYFPVLSLPNFMYWIKRLVSSPMPHEPFRSRGLPLAHNTVYELWAMGSHLAESFS